MAGPSGRHFSSRCQIPFQSAGGGVLRSRAIRSRKRCVGPSSTVVPHLMTHESIAQHACCGSEAGFSPYQSTRLSLYDASKTDGDSKPPTPCTWRVRAQKPAPVTWVTHLTHRACHLWQAMKSKCHESGRRCWSAQNSGSYLQNLRKRWLVMVGAAEQQAIAFRFNIGVHRGG